jgi:ribosomal protein S18 acetylase RimI-like enzyme
MPAALVRRATPADALRLAELRFVFRSDFGEVTEAREAFVARASAWVRARLAVAESDARWLCWVAERDGAVVGNVWLQLLEKLPNPLAEPELHGYVTNFYVVPEARSGGLGTALLDELLAEARRRELDRIVLWPTARSRALYARHGFATTDGILELRPR